MVARETASNGLPTAAEQTVLAVEFAHHFRMYMTDHCACQGT
jgi:hypothetical protein